MNSTRIVRLRPTIPRLRKLSIKMNSKRNFNIDKVLRKHIQQLKPYKPIEPFDIVAAKIGRKPEELVKLDANENVYGPPPEVQLALQNLQYPHIYPDPESRELRRKISDWHGIPMENIMVGAGADELIDLLMRCVLEDHDDVIIDCPPTFTMYAFDAALNNGTVIEVPRLKNFKIDVEKIRTTVEETRPKMLFITSPNNPDGSLVSDEDLEAVLELPVLVVLDEAYQEFTDSPSRITRVLDQPNLVVLRTFSKCAALAGLRVGYGVFHKDLISYLWRAKQPYNVSVAAQVAACAALTNLEYMNTVRDLIVKERERLFNLLQKIPFLEPFPSHSNFIFCKVKGRNAEELKNELYSGGILIRHYNTKHLNDYIRISVGKAEHTDTLLSALKRLASNMTAGMA